MVANVAAVLVAVATGLFVMRGTEGTVPLPLIGLAGLLWLGALMVMRAGVLLIGWVALISFLEPAAADASPAGRVLVWALYVAPVVVMGVRSVFQLDKKSRRSWVDLFPAAFVAYVVLSTLLAPKLSEGQPGNVWKVVFLNVALGVVIYYFLVIGPGATVHRNAVLAALMVGGALQGLLGIVDVAAGWNLWHADSWRGQEGLTRAVSTLANPAVFGIYLGASIVIAVSVLAWGGPRSLRRLAVVTIVLATPALALTLTRGPILATIVVVTLLLALGRTRIVGWLMIGTAVATIALVLPRVQDTPLYQERVTEQQNVGFRLALQHLSIQLAEQKPAFGWGYGSFDTVKNGPTADISGLYAASVKTYTSHDTFLTMLVELGLVGICLFAIPFLVIGTTSVRRLRSGGADAWVRTASVAALGVCVLSAMTFDTRFFSVAIVLPWIFLGLARRPLATGEAA